MTHQTNSTHQAQDNDRLSIISTIDVLLRTAVAKSIGRHPGPFRIITATEFRNHPVQTFRQASVRALQHEPVSHACKLAIRTLGQHLFDVYGSTDKMREVAEDAAALMPGAYGRRIAIIDHAWNGIGTEADMWLS